MTATGDYLRLCTVADARGLHVGLQATDHDGLFRLTVEDGAGREASWSPALLADLDVAAGVVLEELGAKGEKL